MEGSHYIICRVFIIWIPSPFRMWNLCALRVRTQSNLWAFALLWVTTVWIWIVIFFEVPFTIQRVESLCMAQFASEDTVQSLSICTFVSDHPLNLVWYFFEVPFTVQNVESLCMVQFASEDSLVWSLSICSFVRDALRLSFVITSTLLTM